MHKILIWSFTIIAVLFKIWTMDNPTQLSNDVVFSKISESQAQTLFDTLANLNYIEFTFNENEQQWISRILQRNS